ncbi:MAG: DUF4391 domain-containing protein [Acinetobacter johnsonii]|uniref:DUF4391 domain-containing protein n=1 Tax=Acinetobacter johnsonii TaxID=40214 RepID=A0A2W5RW67_ACIJO|nr:MAG: DUF4391 domain-containing protein [Acinetobacter johnsonii]
MNDQVFEVFLNSLRIPASCIVGKPIFKKLFSDATDGQKSILDATDKLCLKDDIEKIRWLYTLKPNTINIPAYINDEREYSEIAVLHFELSNPSKIKRITQFVNRAIPYPLVLLFTHNDAADLNLAMSVSGKRINQADKTKWVIEESFITPWIKLNAPSPAEQDFIQSLSVSSFSFKSFYDFYNSLIERIVALSCVEYSGVFNIDGSQDTSTSRLKILRMLEKLGLKKAELANKLKKEKQMGKQVELNIQVKKINDEINLLKANL